MLRAILHEPQGIASRRWDNLMFYPHRISTGRGYTRTRGADDAVQERMSASTFRSPKAACPLSATLTQNRTSGSTVRARTPDGQLSALETSPGRSPCSRRPGLVRALFSHRRGLCAHVLQEEADHGDTCIISYFKLSRDYHRSLAQSARTSVGWHSVDP